MAKKVRCGWCVGDSLYETYHDQEWGVPVYNDAVFFEFLILETFQAGLSWITILRKRENFRNAFSNFNYNIIANYNDIKLEELKQDSGIIRNTLKIHAAVNNAKQFIKLQEEFGSFSNYVWSFVNGIPITNNLQNYKDAPATSKESDLLSKDLKKRGFKFTGSTVMYAFMQATGLINDHQTNCFRHAKL